MVFKPETSGDFEHYAYVGDIATDFPVERGVAVDAHNHLFTASDERVFEFSLSEPNDPICEYEVSGGGLLKMAVDPESGEVFYVNYKDHKGHQLVCDPGEGQFEPNGEFAIKPGPNSFVGIEALAFNPAYSWEGTRPAGVLYANNSTGVGYVFAQPLSHKPVVESESVSRVTEASATLSAQIDPNSGETNYLFQYLTEEAYQENEPTDRFAGASEAPLGGGFLGSGAVPLSASVTVSGLAPDTPYRFRVVAVGEDPETETVPGEGGAFRTFPLEAPGLADGRSYELVSPPDKHGGEVIPANHDPNCGDTCVPGAFIAHFPIQSAADGEAIVYQGFPFAVGQGALSDNQYISRRSAAGWQTTTLSPLQQSAGSFQGYKAFDAGLDRGILYQKAPALSPSAPSEHASLYLQSTVDPSSLTSLLSAEQPFNRAPGRLTLTFAGASADFSRVFFEADDALTAATASAPAAVDGGEGEGKANLYEWADGQLRLVNVAPGNAATAPGADYGSGVRLDSGNPSVPANVVTHAFSDDGSRTFWTSEAGQLYVRIDGEETLSVGPPGICARSLPVAQRVCFLTASPDGAEVVLSNGQIYALNEAGSAYEPSTDLSQGKGGFKGIVGQSEGLSTIYFVDTEVVVGENAEGKSPVVGQNNLYAWRGGTTTFIATLLASDTEIRIQGTWVASPTVRTAEASPDGRWLAFESRARLTGYDNLGPCGVTPNPPIACPQVFLYDSTTEELRCASCNPSNARPLGASKLTLIAEVEGSAAQSRYLTDSGRLYFDSRDSLTPYDTNEGVGDVYQYEPEGVGSCKREAGCVSLISAGHEPIVSNFMATDPQGKSVFFTTRDQLTQKDRDELIDLYVAREGGGIPAESEVARVECQGEACQPAISAPNDPTPGSSTFEGAGNVDEKKTAKKHKKKRKHAKKKSHKRAAKHNRGGAK